MPYKDPAKHKAAMEARYRRLMESPAYVQAERERKRRDYIRNREEIAERRRVLRAERLAASRESLQVVRSALGIA